MTSTEWKSAHLVAPPLGAVLLFRGALSKAFGSMLPRYIADTTDGQYVYLVETYRGPEHSSARVWGLNEWKELSL